MTMPAAEVSEPAEPGAEPEPTQAPESPLEPAEGEEPGEEPGAEPEPEQEPTGVLSEKQLAKALEQLEREATRHSNRVSEIMGEDAQALLPCELCAANMPGFRWPVAPEEEVKQRVRLAIGDALNEDWLPADDARICDGCGGRGRVRTGSLDPDHKLKLCRHCSGAGWVAVVGPGQITPPGSPSAAVAATGGDGGQAAEQPDPWGRPAGHPHYNLHPVLVPV
jgi:hypothetical protein